MNVLRVGEANPDGYTHEIAAKRSSKHQVEWLHLQPCLVPPGNRQNYQRLLFTVRFFESS